MLLDRDPKQPSAAKEYTSAEVHPPSITLPKGGGAIRGIGEKFAANPVTGTGSVSVPIATSPGRSGFGPQLSLSYDSGAGNGPFGVGWNLSVPSITRKTDKGLPIYQDSDESDVYILSGAEDLAPVLLPDGKTPFMDDTSAPGYKIHRYRPRIEGLFARIERWTNVTTCEIHWRSISRENITTLYGKDNDSRIFDPGDPDNEHRKRIFSWLICESFDDKGNAIVYEYAAENDKGVDRTLANERNRARTANRYLKRIWYGNRVSRLVQPDLTQMEWMFEVVLDYDEGHFEDLKLGPNRPEAEQHRFARASESADGVWPVRPDPFSLNRGGFEVRNYRRCHRVLMFQCFSELGVDPYLVRSTEIDYADLNYSAPVTIEAELSHQGSTRFASFIRSVTQSGFVRDDTRPMVKRDGIKFYTYLKKSLPPLEFEYSKAIIQEQVRELDSDSLENLPVGLDSPAYQWVDLDGEGISGILTDQANAWFYKSNLGDGRFSPLETVTAKPSLAALSTQRQQFVSLAGDGHLDLVALNSPTPGFYKRTEDQDWEVFRPFGSLPNIPWDEPNLRFVDLDGDGHADVLITEHQVFIWHQSLAEEGFGAAQQVRQSLDEEEGPRIVFADGTQSVYLADMCGDGLTDLVRIRNGEVCYWPNLGYGRFGAKVTMDNAPWFDNPDYFAQHRVRLADIDGSGTTDIIYVGRDGVKLYFNQSGNRLSEAFNLRQFPHVDDVSSVMTADLLGNGTACLVWSSRLPGDSRRPMRYIDLMGGQKPHLLIKSVNNLGAETRVAYVSSTKFYLDDKREGKPWITRLPFPVYVVERVETYDRISRNRFVSRYTYHHGYFDGVEREFRGFGRVDERDTEEIGTVAPGTTANEDYNWDAASFVPPVLTRTWFHTGAYLEEASISQQFEHEYYREGDASRGEAGLTDEQLEAMLLDDTVLPGGLSADEAREAYRSLKGSILRQEIYGLDGTDQEDRPYSISERNYTIRCLQSQSDNRHAVFFVHPRETIDFHYERAQIDINGQKRADPRVSHTLTLKADEYGNIERSLAIGYGRRAVLCEPEQNDTHVTLTVSRFTNEAGKQEWYRVAVPIEIRTYELVKPPDPEVLDGLVLPFKFKVFGTDVGLIEKLFPSHLNEPDPAFPTWPYEKWDWRRNAANAPPDARLRLIEHIRTIYRSDDLTGPLLLGTVESQALPYTSYKLAFTPDLLKAVYHRGPEDLLPEPDRSAVLLGQGGKGGYVHSERDSDWWIPADRVRYHQDRKATPADERAHARDHFFMPRLFLDPFGKATTVTYDDHKLLVLKTVDAVGNTVEAANDYRVLQPRLLTDPNGNRSEDVFDALGMVVGTAVMGKLGENKGDLIDASFLADLDEATERAHIERPLAVNPNDILQKATTRLVYDLFAYRRTSADSQPQPAVVYTVARETHHFDLVGNEQTKVQHSFSYSDGLGREVQKKLQAEPETPGGPPRWVGSGWTIFNNKGKPVRQYEPFFTKTNHFEFDARIGVSPILFYDPLERVVATLHPNHTWEKVVFDPWRQETWDVNDTVMREPQKDDDVKSFFVKPDGRPCLPATEYLPTWYALRTDPAYAAEANQKWPDTKVHNAEKDAAEKAAVHKETPTIAHLDALGRTFLTTAHNRKQAGGPDEFYDTRVDLDIEGNQRAVTDAKQRVVMRYDYDMLSNRIHQASMEAGDRWMLNDVAGKALYVWDSRGHTFRTEYDPLRRPLRIYVTGANPAKPKDDLVTERLVYGEQHPEAVLRNLRGQLHLHLDQAGAVANEEHDFKGNLLRTSRRIANQYKEAIDWSTVDSVLPADPVTPFESATLAGSLMPLVEDTDRAYTGSTTYDAVNRPAMLITPHTAAMEHSVIRPGYNEANLLERIDVNLRGARVNGQPVWRPFVTNIDYDAKGQRTLIEYGSVAATSSQRVTTTYEYDPLTFRLIHLLTRRDAVAFPDDCPEPPPVGWPGCQVQNLTYIYDPAGNVTYIRDDAQQTIYFRNQRVEPSAEYTYDAVYRLVEASGREHLGQMGAPNPHSHDDMPRVGLLHPGDGNAMGRYIESYVYDAVGNILEMHHQRTDGVQASGWTRTYNHTESSPIERGKHSNRLSSTVISGNNSQPERYVHDAHGNMIRMPHLGGIYPDPNMQWDCRDQLCKGDLGGGGTAYYTYDAVGQRVRRVWEKSASLEERIYLSGFEIYRRRNGAGAVTLERETVHIMDGKQPIALVENRTIETTGNDLSLPLLIRYQFVNHLGSTTLELDDQAQVISYEEYTPYGSTSNQAVRSQTEAPKRFRFTGKERDEETGLYYHGARYYAAWVGTWVSPDPIGIAGGIDLYSYVSRQPIRLIDQHGLQPSPTGAPPALHSIDWEKELKRTHKVHFEVEYTGVSALEGSLGSLHKTETATRIWKYVQEQKHDQLAKREAAQTVRLGSCVETTLDRIKKGWPKSLQAGLSAKQRVIFDAIAGTRTGSGQMVVTLLKPVGKLTALERLVFEVAGESAQLKTTSSPELVIIPWAKIWKKLVPKKYGGRGVPGALAYIGKADVVGTEAVWKGALEPGAPLQMWSTTTPWGHSAIFERYIRDKKNNIVGLVYSDQWLDFKVIRAPARDRRNDTIIHGATFTQQER